MDDLPPGDVLIRVLWSSLNYKDALSASGNKGVTRTYPHTPGIDAAGIVDDAIEFDKKAVKKVLKKGNALEVLAELSKRFAELEDVNPEKIEETIRLFAEEKELGLGKVAQPLRVAICGNTISPPIFESVDIIGIKSTLERIDNTLKKFSE